ncbi:YibE/F family protein [Aeromicrobium wangtongii]|uniref:YibE/F family protein n=1 Tax=Aeromicrobium wangtongii TaxID=2969247 RepID=A0ABY5MC87_9ACTN|nr:YibE/F family protein [Aeromicrobium wangtongii]MCD9197033.1 YibE/F family protein [Aeromicrobium wangtongii]UUP14534.1 YibE/F family protein [Aeromicrobium wangtongii]
MAHSHSHSHSPASDGPPRRRLAIWLAAVVAVIAAAAVVAMIVLWPDADQVPRDQNPYGAEGVSTVEGTVTKVVPFECNSGGEGPDGTVELAGDCARVTAKVPGGTGTFDLDASRYRAGIDVGDEVQLIRIEPQGQEASYEFLDFNRGVPLLGLAAIFALLVIVVARWRGLFALVGIGVTLFALTEFMLPAFLAGESPLAVAVVGSTVIMIVVLYLAHGISIRTTSALFGTLMGILLTALIGVAATGWSQLSGVGSEDDQRLIATVPDISLSAIVAGTMVIAGLGVLNDVTVTQASAVWELRAARPAARAAELFASAMRIGRDHIASSVYTLVFAYAGSAMTVLLLATAYQRGLADIATTEEIGQEIVRTLVGAIGLVLAVPITTLFAVWLAPPRSAEDPDGVDRSDPAGRHSGPQTAPPA